VSNQDQPVCNTRAIHLLPVGHHQDTTEPASLEGREDSHGLEGDGPSGFLVSHTRRLWVRILPVARNPHRVVAGRGVVRLCCYHMADQDTDRPVLATGLDGSTGGEGLDIRSGTQLDRSKDTQAELTALCQAVLKLRSLAHTLFLFGVVT
jgi:hypothetical protein